MIRNAIAAAMLAALSTPVFAQSGDVTLGYTSNDFSAGGLSIDGDQWTLAGRVDVDLAPSIGLQANLGVNWSDVESFEGTALSGEVIPYYELATGTKIGLALGVYDIDTDGDNISGEQYTIQTIFPVGAAVIQAGAGVGDLEGESYELANISASFGLAPNWTAIAGYTWADVDTVTADELMLGVEWSGVASGVPLVVGLRASRIDVDFIDVDRIGLSVSVPFGGGRGNLFRDDTDVVREYFETIGGGA